MRSTLIGAALGAALFMGAAGTAGAATTTLSMTVDPAASAATAGVSLQSSVSGNPQPALQVLTIAMPKGFAYRGPAVAGATCDAADLAGLEPRCPASSLLGTGTATVEFKNGNVSGTAQVDPVRMYYAGPDDVLFHMKALAPISRGVVVPSTVKFTDPDFGPVFQIGPATGSFGTLALTSFTFASHPALFTTAACDTGSWLAAGRYLFLGGANQEINPRIACSAPGEPAGPATGTVSAPAPAAALSLAGTPVGPSRGSASLGTPRVRVLSTRLLYRSGKVAVRLQCRTKARCAGTVRLQHRRLPGGAARFGAARISIKGGTTKTVKLSLRKRGRTALSRRGARLTTWVRAHLDGQARTRDSVRKLRVRRG